MQGRFIAVDWGTTNRRAYLIEADGTVLRTERDDQGILSVPPAGFAAAAEAIRGRFGALPMLCAGMVGSDRGWQQVAYLPCPADLPALAGAVAWLEPGRTGIVPGISLQTDGRADVMRGEEVQLLGAVAAGLAPPDALLCQPGTHCKWAVMKQGRIDSFVTAMTGEIFALLKEHSLLARLLTGPVAPGPAFRAGIDAARRGDLLANLFEVRAASLLGQRPAAESAAYVSGLLIGSDVAARLGAPGTIVHLLADPQLGLLYSAAIEALGGGAILLDSHAAFVRGITEIWRLCR